MFYSGSYKKYCSSKIDFCKRCGNDRNNGIDHKNCNIKCKHCSGEHEANDYKCTTITKFRTELIERLKSSSNTLPTHTQVCIPKQFRDQKDDKIIENKSNTSYPSTKPKPVAVRPTSTTDDPRVYIPTAFWNPEIRRLHDEYSKLKEEFKIELNTLKNDYLQTKAKSIRKEQMFYLLIKAQKDTIYDLYDTISETITPLIDAIEQTNNVMKANNSNDAKKPTRQQNEDTSHEIDEVITNVRQLFEIISKHKSKVNVLLDQKLNEIENELHNDSVYNNEQ